MVFAGLHIEYICLFLFTLYVLVTGHWCEAPALLHFFCRKKNPLIVRWL